MSSDCPWLYSTSYFRAESVLSGSTHHTSAHLITWCLIPAAGGQTNQNVAAITEQNWDLEGCACFPLYNLQFVPKKSNTILVTHAGTQSLLGLSNVPCPTNVPSNHPFFFSLSTKLSECLNDFCLSLVATSLSTVLAVFHISRSFTCMSADAEWSMFVTVSRDGLWLPLCTLTPGTYPSLGLLWSWWHIALWQTGDTHGDYTFIRYCCSTFVWNIWRIQLKWRCKNNQLRFENLIGARELRHTKAQIEPPCLNSTLRTCCHILKSYLVISSLRAAGLGG